MRLVQFYTAASQRVLDTCAHLQCIYKDFCEHFKELEFLSQLCKLPIEPIASEEGRSWVATAMDGR